jgi:hypothetical protein
LIAADCGKDAHAHVRQADHRGNGGGYFGDLAGFNASHALRRARLVEDFLTSLPAETPEVRLQILEACRRELNDLSIDVEAVRVNLTPHLQPPLMVEQATQTAPPEDQCVLS